MKPEILSPVGSFEALQAASQGGADAIYFGVGRLNMRSHSAANFGVEQLGEIVRRAHEAGMRAYLTANTIIYDDELEELYDLFCRAKEAEVDAVIVSDFTAIMYAHTLGLRIHISTQANVTNIGGVRFYSQWADTIVLARELTLEQVAHIHEQIEKERIPVKIEMFAHGALCMGISGRCYLSAHLCGRSANRGECMQFCRRGYILQDKETGEQVEVDGQYLLSPKDLCTIEFLDKMVAAGVRVLKIEGRARSADYVRRTAEVYSEAVRAIEEGTFTPEKVEQWKTRLSEVFNRSFWEGYYTGKQVPELTQEYGSSATLKKEYIGQLTNYFSKLGVAEVAVQANPLSVGDRYVVMGEKTGVVEGIVEELRVDDKIVTEAPQGVRCSLKIAGVRRGDKFYKLTTEN